MILVCLIGMFPSDIDPARAFSASIGLSSSSKTVYDETARDFLAGAIFPSSEKMVLAEYRTLFLDFRSRPLGVWDPEAGICGIEGTSEDPAPLGE